MVRDEVVGACAQADAPVATMMAIITVIFGRRAII
jgi:hypothetical protein